MGTGKKHTHHHHALSCLHFHDNHMHHEDASPSSAAMHGRDGKVNVEGTLKGANCWKGFGVWRPFLRGTRKGAEFLLATAIACMGVEGNAGDKRTKKGVTFLEGVFVKVSPATIHANFLRAVLKG